MPDLTIPVPKLKFDPVAPDLADLAVLEKPLEVHCAPVAFPDGTVFGLQNLGKAGFFVYRQKAAASPLEIWDQGAKQWGPDPGTAFANLTPKPFAFKQDEPLPWQSLFMAVDPNNPDQFQKVRNATLNFPRYFFRAYFASPTDGNPISGLSAPSATVRFVSFIDAIRAGIWVDETPQTATEVQLFLRNARRQLVGLVEIRNVNGQAQLEIAKWDAGLVPISKMRFDTDGSIEIVSREPTTAQSAAIRLHASGDLDIQPAPGRTTTINNVLEISESGGNVTLHCTGDIILDAAKVIVSDFMDAERILYQPAERAAGTPRNVSKQWLDIT
jgi:hypothetical protein